MRLSESFCRQWSDCFSTAGKNLMNEISPKGLRRQRYINLVRCSSAKQTETSVPDQLKLLNAFADQHEMVHVDDVVLDGVTGSIPGARSDVTDLIQRKQQRDDFDVLLVQDPS